MPYARKNWTTNEVSRLLQNPVHSPEGPHAHSRIHGVEGELASHPLFQRARVNNDVTQVDRRGRVRTRAEVGAHSTLNSLHMSQALVRALNHDRMQEHLAQLDQARQNSQYNFSLKVWVNYIRPVGQADLHRRGGSAQFNVRSLFVYLKPNPSNADLPIFQTIVPHAEHKAFGSVREPVIIVS